MQPARVLEELGGGYPGVSAQEATSAPDERGTATHEAAPAAAAAGEGGPKTRSKEEIPLSDTTVATHLLLRRNPRIEFC